MANQIMRAQMEAWLKLHGFVLQAGKKSSHRQWKRRIPAIRLSETETISSLTITTPGHGPADLTKKHVGIILRQLSAAGFGPTDLLRAQIGDM